MGYYKIEYDNEVLLDLSSDTITSDTLLSGYTAHNNIGESIIGNIPTVSYISGVISNYSQTFPIASGYYAESGSVRIDSTNLISDNIKDGISILGISGIYDRALEYYDILVTVASSSASTVLSSWPLFTAETIETALYSVINENVFYDNQFLKHANFQNVREVYNSAFAECSLLETVKIPNAISIGSSAFNNCTNLISVYLDGGNSSVCSLGANAFSDTPMELDGPGKVYVPASLYSSYISAVNWSDISSHIYSV